MGVNQVSLPDSLTFDWDEANLNKNRLKHNVEPSECEDVFFNNPLINQDPGHSQNETRFRIFGQTKQGRFLFIAFTIRNDKIRVISTRDQNKKEKNAYRLNAIENKWG